MIGLGVIICGLVCLGVIVLIVAIVALYIIYRILRHIKRAVFPKKPEPAKPAKPDPNQYCAGCVRSSHDAHCAWVLTGKCVDGSQFEKKKKEAVDADTRKPNEG